MTSWNAPAGASSRCSSSQANGGGLVTLGLTAHDPDGSFASFSWSASAGQIRSTSWSSTSSEAEWVAPACFDEAVSITATVTDVDGAARYQGSPSPRPRELRLPNLVAGRTYFVLLYALSMPGTSLETPFMYKPDYHFATVFSAMFQP